MFQSAWSYYFTNHIAKRTSVRPQVTDSLKARCGVGLVMTRDVESAPAGFALECVELNNRIMRHVGIANTSHFTISSFLLIIDDLGSMRDPMFVGG